MFATPAADAGRRVDGMNGRDATEAEIQAILDNVSDPWLCGEGGGGSPLIELDDVVLTPGPGPSSLEADAEALLIG